METKYLRSLSVYCSMRFLMFWKVGINMAKKMTLRKGLIRDAVSLVKLNMIFLLFCLPIISIPAAITAMTQITVRLQRGEEPYLFSDFLSTFRDEFFDSLRCGFVVGGGMLIFSYVFWFYQSMNVEAGVLVSLLKNTALLLFAVCYCMSCYLWVINVRVQLPFGKRIKNALALTVICLKQTAFCLVTGIALVSIVLFGAPYSTPFTILAAFSFWNYICVFYVYPVIEKFIVEHKKE